MTTDVMTIPSTDFALTQWTRIADLFVAPTRLFRSILKDGSWWLPFLLTVICSYSLTFTAAYKIGFEQMVVNAMQANSMQSGNMDAQMSAEQKESTINTAETIFKVSAFAGPAVILLYNVVYALALWLGLIVVAGGWAEFSSIFAVLLYADMIQNVRTLMATIVLWFNPEPTTFNIQNALGSNIGYYLGSGTAPWLRTLLETTDVLTIWYLILIALGCSVVAKVKRGSSATVVFGLWLLIVASRVLWAAIT